MTPGRGSSLLLVVCALLGLGAGPVLAATGVGAAPDAMRFDDARRSEARLVSLDVLGSSEEDSLVSFTIDGAAASWLAVVGDDGAPLEELYVPRSSRATVGVALQVPRSASNGRYAATITLATRPGDDAGPRSDVEVAVVVPVTVDVTGSQRIDGRMTDVVVAPVAEVSMPLRFELVVQNDGNVAAAPEVSASLVRAGEEVAATLVAGTAVPPGEAGLVSGALVTSHLAPGEYGLRLSAALAGEVVETHERGVELVPAGTLDREVRLTGLTVSGASRAGEIGAVAAEYRNGGAVSAEVQFVGDVRRDGVWVDEVSSITVVAEPGDSGVLESFFAVPSAGVYDLEGRLLVDGVPGAIERVRLGIDVPFYATIPDWLVAAAAALLMFPLFAGVFVAHDRRRRREAAAARERVLRKLGRGAGVGSAAGAATARGHRSRSTARSHETVDVSAPNRPPARRSSFRPESSFRRDG